MRYHEISEKLKKRQIPNMRGNYADFVITMHPADFLKLTARTNLEFGRSDYDRIMSDKYPLEIED